MATNLRPHFRRLSCFIVCGATAAFASARGHDHYQVVEIGALGAALSYANSINDSGVVVGNVQYSDGHLQAFIWDATHGIRRIDPSARQSIANCISNTGIVAGAVEDENRLVDAVIWTAAGNRSSVAWAPFGAIATCVNRSGEVVGYRQDGIFEIVDRAFAYPAADSNSAWTELFDTDHDSFATSVNDRGQIVGTVDRQAFLIESNGQLRILAGSPNSGLPATAVAINNHGDVLVSQFGTGFVVEKSSRAMIRYDAPVFPLGINDREQVVGYVDNGSRDAFVWDRSSGVLLLNDLVDTPGWQIFSANAVNRKGMIAGYGIKNGRRRAVVLVPVKGPERQAAP